MLLPFQRKTFTTSLNVDDVKTAVRAVINERNTSLFKSKAYYSGSMDGTSFTIRRNFPTVMKTRIKGIIRAENPTIVELRSAPSYFLLALLSCFALVFIYVGFSSDKMTINGVVKVPDISDRIFVAFGGSLIPAMIFVGNSIVDTWRAEGSLKERLGLRE